MRVYVAAGQGAWSSPTSSATRSRRSDRRPRGRQPLQGRAGRGARPRTLLPQPGRVRTAARRPRRDPRRRSAEVELGPRRHTSRTPTRAADGRPGLRKQGKTPPPGVEVVDPGYKGIQKEVLTPGTYKINPFLYEVTQRARGRRAAGLRRRRHAPHRRRRRSHQRHAHRDPRQRTTGPAHPAAPRRSRRPASASQPPRRRRRLSAASSRTSCSRASTTSTRTW